MKVYVASSWKNDRHQEVAGFMMAEGFEVFDFRNPEKGERGFHWSEIDPLWEKWTPKQYLNALDHPLAARAFRTDMAALESCEALVLVLPCGSSSHLELGYAIGRRKHTAVLLEDVSRPELMYRSADFLCTELGELADAFGPIQKEGNAKLRSRVLREHVGKWEPLSRVSRSGKRLFVCMTCGRHTPNPSTLCMGSEFTYEMAEVYGDEFQRRGV